jgi:prophage antirepressor-like protein
MSSPNHALQIFEFNGAKVRTAGTFDAPLFCAVDVCDALKIEDAGKAVNRLDSDEVEIIGAAKNGSHAVVVRGAQANVYLTESGLYAVIFQSRKPGAKAFKKWVTSEVLPAIRKSGYYSAIEAAREKTAAQLLAACFPNAPAKAKPIFSELISALLKMRHEAPIGNPPWSPLLASIIYELAIPITGQQQKRRALNRAPKGNRVDHSMFSPELKTHVIDVARAGIALAKNSNGWGEWRARMETAFRDAPLQLSLITPIHRLPKKGAA